MAIDVIDVLAEMDEEKQQLEERSSGNFKFVFLQMSVGPKKKGPATVGQKTVFRPLFALDQSVLMYMHSDFNASTNTFMNAVCAREIGRECHWCKQAKETGSKRLEARKSLMLPVWMHFIKDQFEKNSDWFAITSKDENGVEKPVSGLRILELQNFGVIERVYARIRRVHTGDRDEEIPPRDIRTLDFILECHGQKKDKKIDPTPKEPSPMTQVAKAATPTREAVREMVLEARPPKIVGEDVSAYTYDECPPEEGVSELVY